MTDVLIRHGYVVTVDPERRIFRDGAVAIDGSRITYVGPTADAPHRADTVIDANDRLVIPGLIDAHHHPSQYLSRGIADDVHILVWLYERVYPYEAALTPEDAYVSALGSCVEAVRTGTTLINDPGGPHADRAAEAIQRVGIRGIVNRSTRDISTTQAPIPAALIEDTDTAVREAEVLLKRWNEDAADRIRAWTSLRYVYNVSDDLARRIKRLADQHRVGIHAHCAAVAGENELVQSIFGMRSIERYHQLGLLGPNLCLVHMGWVNDAEIELLYEHGVKVVHCPSASMHGAYGNIGNRMFPRMIDRGLTVGLGTDSATAGRFLDMVRVMYLAACAHKDSYADARIMGAYKALEMATIDGARAVLWEDQVGSLEVGKRADVVLVDMRGFQWQPMRDPVTNFIYTANGESVETVIVDGNIVVHGRRVLTVDAEAVRTDVQRAANDVVRRAGIDVRLPWPVL